MRLINQYPMSAPSSQYAHLPIFYIQSLPMQVMNEEHEEGVDLERILTPNQEKVKLIDTNVASFRRLVRASLLTALLRIAIFFVIFLNEEAFICSQENQCDGWTIIFYILASLMDLLVVLNDSQILRFLKKQELTLMTVKQQLAQNKAEIGGTALGAYGNYLDLGTIITVYKFRMRSMTSISKTINFLQFFITFCIFGQLALDSQFKNGATLFQTAFLWLFILSIYFTVFQLDFLTIQAGPGPYVQPRTTSSGAQPESTYFSQIKDNYVRRIRRPFEVIYIVSILLLLTNMIMYFSASLVDLMMGLCVVALMGELIYEKNMQNRLVGLNLAAVNRVYLTPQQVRWQISRKTPKTHTVITTTTRIAIVMLTMAYFRSPSPSAVNSLMLVSAFLLLTLGQAVKSECVQRGRLYLLSWKKMEEGGGQCSICLLNCQKGQKVLTLPCFADHVFHADCLKSWLRQRKECPLCRHSLKHYDITI